MNDDGFEKFHGKSWQEVLKQKAQEDLSIAALIASSPYGEIVKGGDIHFASEHPADEFDRMTSNGWKLNLLTGEYEKKP